jgi:hypothetical protein
MGGFQLWRVPAFIYQDTARDMAAAARVSLVAKRQVVAEAIAKTRARVNESLKLGEKYGPKQYYADLRFARSLQQGCERKHVSTAWEAIETSPTRRLFMHNMNRGLYSQAELAHEQRGFRYWLEKANSQDQDEFSRSLRKWGWHGLFAWLFFGWMVGIFLVPVIYATRHAELDGFRIGYQANPLRFWLATFFWPLLILKYPTDMVRELWVEVRLRQMGGLFRRLLPSDRQLIRKVANDTVQYRQFMRQTRRFAVNPLMLALVVTLLCRIGLGTTSAQTFDRSGHSVVQMSAAPHLTTLSDATHVDPGGGDSGGVQAIDLTFLLVVPPVQREAIPLMVDEVVRDRRRAWRLDHVPLHQVMLRSIHLAGAGA